MAVSWHWVCLEDDDLALIEDGPQPDEGEDPEDCTEQDLWDWVLAVQEAIADGLESA
jgi:hypothetical protein